jgi:hypothetical protein
MALEPSPESNWPIVNWIILAFNFVLALLVMSWRGAVNLYRGKVDVLETNQGKFVTRTELDGHIDKLREDQQRMHQENLNGQNEIRASINSTRVELSGQIREVHSRIDDVIQRG